VLVLIVLGIRYWPWPQRCLLAPKLFPACQLPAMKHIGILPFENLAGDAGDRALFTGLEQTVASELAQLGVLENSLCVHRIRTPAESSGLDLLISGTTARVGENLRVTAALSDPVTKLRLREISRDIDRRNLLSFQNELAGQFAGMAGVRLVPEMNMGGTAIWPAFEFYLRGLGYLGQGEIDTAIESLQSALAVDAYYVAAHASLGEAFRKRYSQTRERKWLDQAIAECQRAVEGEAQPAAAYGTLGMAYLETRQFDKAVEAFTRALKLDPLNTETRAKLADALGTLDRRDEARAVIWEGVRLRPECWLSHSEAGAFLYGQGDFADAEKEDFIALKLAPASASVLNMLGALYYQTDQLQKAREFLERSRRADPSDLVPANNLGALYYRLGCYADSARSYEEATNLGEKDSRVWGSFGEALLKAPNRKGQAPGVFRKAIELARQELAADSTNQEVRRMLANDYARTNDQKRARETIETALKQAPKDADVQFRAVLVYEMLQDRKLAVEALKAALAARLLAKICADPGLEDLRRDPQFAQLAPGGCPAPKSPGPGGCPSAGPAPRK
jgi:tetratricopeptide (TPR) repeat protein